MQPIQFAQFAVDAVRTKRAVPLAAAALVLLLIAAVVAAAGFGLMPHTVATINWNYIGGTYGYYWRP